MKQPISDEDLIILMMSSLLGIVVIDDFPALEYQQHQRDRRVQRRVDRRTVPFTGIRRIVNPGGSKFALCFSRVFLEADNIAFHEQFRMKRSCFESLTRWYALNTNLLDSQRQSLPQRLLVFLYILAWDAPQRLVAHRFRISQSAVSSIFHQALQATMRLAKALITMPEPGWVSPTIELDPRLCQFNGCVGAIDGTHIPIFAPSAQKERFIGHKGQTQNVFAAVSPAGRFQFVIAGADGRMHDTTLFENAITKGFDVPEDRFYIADAGFGLRKGILIPYRGTRFHLQEWRELDRQPETRQELFNREMSGIRASVECVFGITKGKFKIIRTSAPHYSIRTQVKVVYACCAIYNFIFDYEDRGLEREVAGKEEIQGRLAEARLLARDNIPGRSGMELRNQIANNLWTVRETLFG